MPFVAGGKVVGRDNRAAGSAAYRENQIAGVEHPPPNREATYCGPVKSVTLTSTGGVATGSSTAHGFSVGDVVVIKGAAEAGYNGSQSIATVADANTFTYVFYGSSATSSGTITATKILSGGGD